MFNKNLKTILSNFEKNITDLEALITSNSVKVDDNNQVIRRREENNLNLIAESQQAKEVSDKLRDVVGGL